MAKKKKRSLVDRLMMGAEKSEGYARASLPSNRWELFWDIFKGRFGKIIVVNLLVLLFCLPLILIFLFRYIAVINYGSVYPFSQSIGIGYGALPHMTGMAENIIFSVNSSMYILLPVAFVIASIGISGGAYVFRNMVWTEGIFVANDFWRGIKQNFKQITIILLLYSVIFYICNLSISLCEKKLAVGTDMSWLFTVSEVLAYIFIFAYSVMTLHMISMSVTYELKLRHLLKNSIQFTIALLPHNVFFLAICLIPLVFLLLDGFLLFIGVLILIFFAFSFVLLVWTNYCQWIYDKFINDKIAGAQKNRGIYQKVKQNDKGALSKYKEQMSMATRSTLNSKPIKPITDEELVIEELPESFSRKDIEKLNESKQRLYDDHAKYVETHKNDPEFMPTEEEIEREKQRQERERRIEKARRELAKRNRKK